MKNPGAAIEIGPNYPLTCAICKTPVPRQPKKKHDRPELCSSCEVEQHSRMKRLIGGDK